jgi:hypothetical protein
MLFDRHLDGSKPRYRANKNRGYWSQIASPRFWNLCPAGFQFSGRLLRKALREGGFDRLARRRHSTTPATPSSTIRGAASSSSSSAEIVAPDLGADQSGVRLKAS